MHVHINAHDHIYVSICESSVCFLAKTHRLIQILTREFIFNQVCAAPGPAGHATTAAGVSYARWCSAALDAVALETVGALSRSLPGIETQTFAYNAFTYFHMYMHKR